jgi:multidrug efflux pump subunit AcrA (membrane-fusion protein)
MDFSRISAHTLLERNVMVNDSVGALHVALAAAVVGWLVFSISHSVAVWKKRNANGEPRASRGLLYAGLFLCAAALAGGWLNRELTRRAGVILGTDFFVVRAHTKTTPHLVQGDSIEQGARLATFDDLEGDREEAHLRGDIAVIEEQIADARLKPLVLDPELLRVSQDVSDTQRARLSQLGYGVLHAEQADSFSSRARQDNELAAERAQSSAAELQYERTASLVKDGIFARNKLEAAAAAAQTAAQKLRERENLLRVTEAGYDSVAHTESAIARDIERAKAERNAELAELDAQLAEVRASLVQLHRERSVVAPFAGTIVYRHQTPALAKEDQVILALAKGSGFLATVQVPAREAAMLAPGHELRMKLNHSLVSEEMTGRLQSVQLVPGNPDRRDLLIACVLPPEQFAAFATGIIPVTLQWRPPIYADRFTQAGFVFLLLSVVVWLIAELRARMLQAAEVERVFTQLGLSAEEFSEVGR